MSHNTDQSALSKWCLRHSSGHLFVVLHLPPWVAALLLPSFASTSRRKMPLLQEEIQLTGIFLYCKGIFYLHLINMVPVWCENWVWILCSSLFVCFFFFQKPKQKDWHPPGGFILGLWALIIIVFFKTYGIKHMKHVFWIQTNKMIALAAMLDSLVSPEFSVRVLWLEWKTVFRLLLKVLSKSCLLCFLLQRVWQMILMLLVRDTILCCLVLNTF